MPYGEVVLEYTVNCTYIWVRRTFCSVGVLGTVVLGSVLYRRLSWIRSCRHPIATMERWEWAECGIWCLTTVMPKKAFAWSQGREEPTRAHRIDKPTTIKLPTCVTVSIHSTVVFAFGLTVAVSQNQSCVVFALAKTAKNHYFQTAVHPKLRTLVTRAISKRLVGKRDIRLVHSIVTLWTKPAKQNGTCVCFYL